MRQASPSSPPGNSDSTSPPEAFPPSVEPSPVQPPRYAAPLSGASLGLEALSEPKENLAWGDNAVDGGQALSDGGHLLSSSSPSLERLPPTSDGLDERYQSGGLIGRGGMGEIRAVYDPRLKRQVALKMSSSPDPRSAQRLQQEAMITARLAHPGIIAVHELGQTPDGRPFYTMPIVQGKTLGEATEGLKLSERLRLVRHFLDACEAVAYAHSQGILHRDLKPANILVGQFGETAVVDWGLAGAIGESASLSGAPVGTPGYMSPEQQRGESLQPSADVYSLGITLLELLTGETSPPTDATPHAQASADKSPLPSPGSIPDDLLAIVRHATRPNPAERYADARALAEDVGAWFEGRQVKAHRYSPQELARRALVAYRGPLLVGALALLLIASVAAFGYWRTSVARDEARQSQQEAIAARADSDQHLAQAEIAQALDAMARDEWGRAEILAASALTEQPSPEARGVLAHFDLKSRPRLLRRMPLPDCNFVALSEFGEKVACAFADKVQVFDAARPLSPPMEISGRVNLLVLVGKGDRLLADLPKVGMVAYSTLEPTSKQLLEPESVVHLFDAQQTDLSGWLSGNRELWTELSTGRTSFTTVCLNRNRSVPALLGIGPQQQRVFICLDGQGYSFGHGLSEAPEAETPRPLFKLDLNNTLPQELAFSQPFGTEVAVASTGGQVDVFDTETGERRYSLQTEIRSPLDMALSHGRLAISDGQEHVDVWQLSTGVRIARLAARAGLVRWTRDPNVLRVAGRAVEDWQLSEKAPPPHVRHSEGGISALDISPDGSLLVSAHGSGHLTAFKIEQKVPLWRLMLHKSVVKDVAFSPDGRLLAATCSLSKNLFVLNAQDPASLRTLPANAGRRLAWLSAGAGRNGWLLLAPYSRGILRWSDPPTGAGQEILSEYAPVELEVEAGETSALMNCVSHGVGRIRQSDPTRVEPLASTNETMKMTGSPSAVCLLTRTGLEVRLASGKTFQTRFGRTLATDAVVSPDGAIVAVGHQNGRISVWSTDGLSLLAILNGHTSRVSALQFDASGQWLVSGCWDGDIRLWSMRALKTPPAELLKEATEAWGQTLGQVLHRGSAL